MATHMLSETFKALAKEADFSKEMLGAGATQIRKANFAAKGIYFQAFTSLSTGLERIGKLCLMLDHFIDHAGKFPDHAYMKKEIGHNISVIYEKSAAVVVKRSISMKFLQDLSDPIHQAILKILSEFALSDRYSNIDLLVGSKPDGDPIASWFREVDKPLYDTCVSKEKRESIRGNATAFAAKFNPANVSVMVLHTSETGSEITDLEEIALRTGMQSAIGPYRQLNVLQVIRYWAELLRSLQNMATQTRSEDIWLLDEQFSALDSAVQAGIRDIPSFDELFSAFLKRDSYLRRRKTWDTV